MPSPSARRSRSTTGIPRSTRSGEPDRVCVDGCEQEALHALLGHQVQVRRFLRGVLPAVAENDREACFCGGFFGAARDVGEERVGGVEHQQADRATATRAQLTRRLVAHEAERLDGGLDPVAGLFGHPLRSVQHVRHGSDRDPGMGRDILDAARLGNSQGNSSRHPLTGAPHYFETTQLSSLLASTSPNPVRQLPSHVLVTVPEFL